MSAVSIIKNNQNELDAGDFTTLLTAIDPCNPEEQLELTKVLSMLREAGVEPFNQYEGPYAFRQIVQLGCEVFDPEKFTAGLLIVDTDYEKRWKPYIDIFEILGISILQEPVDFSNELKVYYLVYITKDGGVEDKLLYWRDVLGGTWRGIK